MAWGYPGRLLPAAGSTDRGVGAPVPGGLCSAASPPALLPLRASSRVMAAAAVASSWLEVARKSLRVFHSARWLRRGSRPPSLGVVFGAIAAMICQLCLRAPVPLRVWHAHLGSWLPQPHGLHGTAQGELFCGGRAAGTWLLAARVPLWLCAAVMQCQHPWGSR